MSGYTYYSDDTVVLPIEASIEPQNTYCLAMYRHWSAIGPEVSFSVIDLIQLPEVLSLTVLLDFEAEAQDFRFRFVGQRIADITGRDLTGMRVFSPESIAPLSKRLCEEIIKDAKPLISRTAFTVTQANFHYEFDEVVALPIFDDNKALSGLMLVHGLSS